MVAQNQQFYKDMAEYSFDSRWNPISFYLMGAYAYYMEDDPIMADHQFDDLAKYLLKHIDDLPDHVHKHLITKEDLRAGTYLGEYPEQVKGALYAWRRQMGLV